MIESISINNNIIEYDKKKTSVAYLDEIKIKECPCSDCHFFVNVITKLYLEIFQILIKAGTDLEKNLKNEPTGVWCIRDDNDEFVFFQQTYLIKGTILQEKSFLYTKEEFGFKIEADFINYKKNIIIDLRVIK